jgi:hypothetical protein
MKKITRLLLAFIVVSFLLICCNKENNEPQNDQKKQFAYTGKTFAFSAKNLSILHRFAEIIRKLEFASSVQLSSFVQQSAPLNFTGGSGIPVGPGVSDACLISTLGESNLGIEWVFNYYDDGRISHINEFEDGDEILILFTYNSKGQIIKTEYYEVVDGVKELALYDVFQYDSQGLVTQVHEFLVGGTDTVFYFINNNLGQTTKIYTDFYDSEFICQYSNGNVIKEIINVTYSGTVYTETTTYSYDNKNNFWKPLDIPQPFFSFFAWMESENNRTKLTYTDIEGETYSEDFYYEYNAEGYPTSIDCWPIVYFNCGN